MAYAVYDAVVEVLDELNYLNLAFENDLISDAALARFITPRVAARLGNKATLPTVTSSVRRYLKTKPYHKIPSIELVKLLSSSKVSLQTGLAEVHAVQTPDNYDKITMLAKNTQWSADDPFYVIPQANSISIISGAENTAKILEQFSEKDVLKVEENRALVTISYDPKAFFDSFGGLHFYTGQFAHLGISIISIFSAYDRVSFLISQSDASGAFKKLNLALNEITRLHAKK